MAKYDHEAAATLPEEDDVQTGYTSSPDIRFRNMAPPSRSIKNIKRVGEKTLAPPTRSINRRARTGIERRTLGVT